MDQEKSILSRIRIGDVDQSEFELVLQAHFGHGRALSETSIEYRYAADGPSALALQYDDDGLLVGAFVREGLRANTIDQLASEVRTKLVEGGKAVVRKRVLFSRTPVVGWFRYLDKFQIRPPPNDAPLAPTIIAPHPFWLEYRFRRSVDNHISIFRGARVAKELELLLIGVLIMMDGLPSINARYSWVIPPPQEGTEMLSDLRQELYTWPGQTDPDMDDFTPAPQGREIRRIPLQEYYRRLAISVGEPFAVPDGAEHFLDAYFNDLSANGRERFLRASYWLRWAEQVIGESKSAGYTALVSAVEALMGRATGGEKCPTCKMDTGPGPTARFKSFVERFAPSPHFSNADRRRLYSLRSDLSHGSKLMHEDRMEWGPAMTARGIQSWTDRDNMWQVVRAVLVNWLGDKRRSESA